MNPTTCSVIIYSKKDHEIRLCKNSADRLIEVQGQTMFAICKRHRDKSRMLIEAANTPYNTAGGHDDWDL